MLKTGSPCFLLYKRAANDWLIVTWMPEGSKIRERMVYSAGKETLKRALGSDNFVDEVLCNSEADLEGSHYSKPGTSASHMTEAEKPYSKKEKLLMQGKADEEKERKRRSMVPGGEKRLTSGFHAVLLALTAEASEAVESVPKSSKNFVHLSITEDKDKIELTSQVSASGKLPIAKKEPGYYLYQMDGKVIFIYCCPDDSEQKIRMVYSTAKPMLMMQIEDSCGVKVDHKMESSDPSELTDSFIRDDMRGGPDENAYTEARKSWRASLTGSLSRGSKKTHVPSAYTLPMPPGHNIQGGSSSRKKKIVIPPPGAYM